MATSTAQRTGIWIIAIAMIVGTVVGFIAMILGSQNQTANQKLLQDYSTAAAAAQKKLTEQTAQLSKQYFASFKPYEKLPQKFDAKSVTKLTTKDLKVGTGETVTAKSKIAVYYIGWNPSGKVFDQSIDGSNLKAPFDPQTGIEGFKSGVLGMKVGGVRELSIPSNLAYKEQGSGDDIPPNTPIKFIVMAIPQPEQIKQPEITKEIIDAYSARQQQ